MAAASGGAVMAGRERCVTDEPPFCCQNGPLSDAEWAARRERIRVAETQVRAKLPRICPYCGSADIVPSFEPLDGWECCEPTCLTVWTVEA